MSNTEINDLETEDLEIIDFDDLLSSSDENADEDLFTENRNTGESTVSAGENDEEDLFPEEKKADRNSSPSEEEFTSAPRRKKPGKFRKLNKTDKPDPDSEAYDPRTDAEARPPKKGKRLQKTTIIALVIAALIVVILIIAIIRLVSWSKGETLQLSDGSDKFLVEVNDNMVLLPDSKLEGHEDDGVTTIVCLGNDPFSDNTGDTGLAGQIEQLGGNVKTINASFPNSQITCLNPKYDPSDVEGMDDIFNLFYVTYAIAIDDYSSLETVATLHEDNPQYSAAIEALENTDFNDVDMIAIMYDAVDYENGMPIVNEGYDDELTTYVGALKNSFKLIQDKYPHIRIVFMSPTFMLHKTEDGELKDGRVTDLGNGTLIQYWQWAYDYCGSSSVSFLDNYYGSINDANYEEYLKDNIHINDKGFNKIADHFVYKVVKGEYGEYDANKLMCQ